MRMNEHIITTAFVARSDAKPIDYFTELQENNYTHIVLKDGRDYIGVLDVSNVYKYPNTRIFEDMTPDCNWKITSPEVTHTERINNKNSYNGFIVCDNNGFKELIPSNNSKNDQLLNLKNEYVTYLKFLKHEFLNIANGIHGLTNMLSLKDNKTLDTDEFNLLEMISSKIIEFSEVHLNTDNTKDFKSFKVSTHMNNIVQDTILTVKSEAMLKNVEINSETYISGDFSLVLNSIYYFQIIVNVLINAIRYSEESSSIKIVTRIEDNEFQLFISDTGSGISASEVDEIFIMNYRGESSQNIHGSGLGLSIVKKFADGIDAHCGINSPPKYYPIKEHAGSEFWLKIPIV